MAVRPRQGGPARGSRAQSGVMKKKATKTGGKATAGTKPVAFEYFDPGARTVTVAGDFNQWSPSARPLRRDAGGRWSVSVKLPPGSYHYRFVVDGDRWVEDPLNSARAVNDYGTFNSVRLVSE